MVQVYRDRAAMEEPYELRRHSEPLRLTLLAVPIRPCMYKRSSYLYF